MINHTYCSSIVSTRTSFSFNECSYYSNERCPSTYCSCCSSFLTNSSRFTVPINPSFLYGLRQSTLIQCSPSRRLVLGLGDRYCFRSPALDVGRSCNGECCCVKRERVGRLLGNGRKERCSSKNMSVNVNVNVDRIRDRIARRNNRCSALEDAEAMLSLLTEESVEQCLDVTGRRRWRPSMDGNIVRKQIGVSEGSRDRKEKLRSGYLGGRLGGHRAELVEMKSKEEVNKRSEERKVLLKEEEKRSRRKESSTGKVESLLDKVQLVSSEVQSRKEDYRRREEDREDISREEEQWSRRTESGSSYYSACDTSDLESDTEVEVLDERLVEDSSVRHGKDLKQMGSVVIKEEKRNELRRHRDERDQQMQRITHDNDFRVGSSVAWISKAKSEGNVFSNEGKRESERNRDERNRQQLQSNKHIDMRVINGTEWDWRKKSEKRLTEESAEETKSRRDSAVRHSQMSQTHKGSSMKVSRSEKLFNYQEEGSTSGGSFHGQFRSHIEKDNRVSEVSKLSARHEQSTQAAKHNVEATSDIQRRSEQGQEGIMVVGQSGGCKYCNTCGRTMQQDMTQTGVQQMAELSELCDDAKWTSAAQSESESRLKQEMSSTSLQTSVQEENKLLRQMRKQHYSKTVDTHDNYVEGTSSSQQQSDAHMIHMKNLEQNSSSLISRQEVKGLQKKSGLNVIQDVESSRVAQTGISASQVDSTNAEINRQSASEHHSRMVYAHDNYVEDISSSQKQSETLRKNLEESSLISRQEAKRLQEKSGRKVINEIESSTVAETGISASQVHSTNVETNCQSGPEQRIYNEPMYSTKVKSEEELVEKRKYINETILESRLRTEVERPIVEATYSGNFSGEATVSQPSIALISQTGVQQASEGEAIITGYDSGGTTQVGEASVYIYPQARTPSPPNEVSSGSESYEEPSQGDSLASAERMEASSIQIVGGFIEDMRHEASTQDSKHQVETGSLYTHPQARTPFSDEVSGGRSESYEDSLHGYALVSAERMEESSIQIVGKFVEKMQHEVSTSHSTHQDEYNMLKESTQSDSEKTIFQKQESRHSSGSSESKGPSDDMSDAKDHFAQEPSERDSSHSTTSENVTVRTGKSFWNILAGVLRLQSGSNAETQKSSVKSSGHSSPNESVSDEAWSSDDKVDEANGETVKTEDTSLPQEPPPRSRKEDLGMMISDDRMSYVEVGASSSSSFLQTGSLSGGPSCGANPNFNVTQEVSQSSPLDLTVSPARRLKRSHEFKETEESGPSKGPTKLTGEWREQSVDVWQSGLKIASVATDAKAKQGKLQRSNQVLHERYYEWEDAYRREKEQREVDEIFMREALEEAKRAAGSWEVPVGAVLVRNGNIIARGYNIVEQLRDSTAHAEMICIREASNVLQTWRLSETTLYVTLEPCPMCAGAILQARVGTLVWGAPNKLLGADGSWIWLFPDRLAGEERPEVADKPAAPAHPFHPNMKIRRGVLEPECAYIMQQFFQLRRREEKPSREPTERPKLLHKIFKFPPIHKKRSS